MTKLYKSAGEEFELDDSEGCYIKVTYKDQVGCVGVNLQGVEGKPYVWYGELRAATKDGLQYGFSSGLDLQKNLDALCSKLVDQQREADEQAAFKPEDSCQALHEFVQQLD